jgi:hypothetical protein
MSPEVLIYIQKIKNYLESNLEAKEYFLSNSDNDFFFIQLKTLSNKNFVKNGDPQLTLEQLELIRRMSMIVLGNKKSGDDNLFMDMGEFGQICLN